MDINAINDAIKTLEESETTVENVQELANLYTVRDKLSLYNMKSHDSIPHYHEYKNLKIKFQKNEVPEEIITKSCKTVCNEIMQLFQVFHAGTDTDSERDEIHNLIKSLSSLY